MLKFFFLEDKKSIKLFSTYCFEELNFYEIEIKFKQDPSKLLPSYNSVLNVPTILIDSVIKIYKLI